MRTPTGRERMRSDGMSGLLGGMGAAVLALALGLPSLTRASVPGPPQARPDRVVTWEGHPVLFDPLDNDAGPLVGAMMSILIPPQHGDAVAYPILGRIEYTPDPAFNGDDHLRYEACDASGAACSSAQVDVRVEPWGHFRLLYMRADGPDAAGLLWRLYPDGSDAGQFDFGFAFGRYAKVSPGGNHLATSAGGTVLFAAADDPLENRSATGPGEILSLDWLSNSTVVASIAPATGEVDGWLFPYGPVLFTAELSPDPLAAPELTPETRPSTKGAIPIGGRHPSRSLFGNVFTEWYDPESAMTGTGIFETAPFDAPRLLLDDLYARDPDGAGDGRIAYAHQNQIRVWKMGDSDGATIFAADPPAVPSEPRWSPDDTKISFLFLNGVWVMNADGSEAHLVFYDDSTVDPGVYALDPDWDPREATEPPYPTDAPGQLVFERDGLTGCRTCDADRASELARVHPDAASLALLEQRPGPAGDAHDPHWSPDGRRLVYWGTPPPSDALLQSAIFVAAGSGAHPRVVTPPGLSSLRDPSWSPAGDRIVFSAVESATGHAGIWVANPDGTDPLRLSTSTASAPDRFPVWSSAGWIAFTAGNTSSGFGSTLVYVVRPDGSHLQPLSQTSQLGPVDRAAWSPDGGRLAFTVVGALFVADFSANPDPDLGPPRRLLTRPLVAMQRRPSWSPDGTALAFETFLYDPITGGAATQNSVFVVNDDGTRLVALAPGRSPHWNPVPEPDPGIAGGTALVALAGLGRVHRRLAERGTGNSSRRRRPS
jgi:Tol biopolymer transport system component